MGWYALVAPFNHIERSVEKSFLVLQPLELFGTANVSVAYAAAAGALQLTEGKTKPGIVWPEELDAARFIDLSNTLGLTLNLSVN